MLLQVERLSKHYRHADGQVDALKDVALDVEERAFVTVTGPSGSGKSTLLLMLGGLMRPSSGSIRFRSESLTSMSDGNLARFRLRHVGFVTQNFSLIPYVSALSNVMVPMSLGGVERSEQRRRAAALLDAVGLSERINHLPRELSVGQQQRVAIARAMANGPALVLADEPTGNLDPSLARDILELLGSFNRRDGLTVVMATHSAEAADFGNVRVRLRDGRLEQPASLAL